ncbi:AraC family transcriptional regulator [Brachybacterium sp. P6-10-X1]|uniref:helix-turn-helix domain-containing protein n=1 Tax=Brachybacterium sp. P6-10-X1 TaxID=1903186 RepID=UPI000971B5FF|nr:helix-turn-helix domain-containing protein [Brachybacterium sp. P6-10-X1]APX33798.1 AraC family transcriptional regulator [Brachybacterium sp. P6-10-X1]
MADHGTDPLRRLLDSVLDEGNRTLADMARGAHISPFHLARTVVSRSGESPAAMRRRILLERAAWSIQQGESVTEAAFAADYESMEGFSRAFRRAYGHAPSAMPPLSERGHWLTAPNGLHFHSPTALYVDAGQLREHPSGDVLALMVAHDVDDIDLILAVASELSSSELALERLPGSAPRAWDGPDASLIQVLRHLALSKSPWLASISGDEAPDLGVAGSPVDLAARHQVIGPRWLAMVRDVEARGAWSDRIVDALCTPPESFQLSQIVAHELTFSAHRRLLARWMLADAGADLSAADLDPDPILWHRRLNGELS